ncbi:hypothetical protein Pmar_PMAR012910 [Perkinsus marinus ATCC 50983]|uniref:Pinin/SDK/MemA protein domain-containing protein n=1 Tax=Perkinsus marinus (strain ATCC 50983 / TXsc) TaxID=423536 RepID=C5LWI4_PERM5|nr:hypothetical protein Pmar_PMAR012910 [Perkinsus marinus ATCC 50983]EEQ98897.1 hypothetical protein Pmar_PMAR012910 [Perkinsus marinus ATCC 50983]|eukprot:XP_002766180.1 hypothetical protein Pmar_PMAR012910 [Perkinsus marinus ATCC 50983]
MCIDAKSLNRVVVIRESMKRNRRMFGNLLGHLGSARQRLENDRKRDAIQRQEECAQRVEAKLARQRNNLREIRRLEWEERRKQDRERLIEQKIALIPYSFAEFAEPTSAVLAGGSKEEKGKELEMGAVEETQERAREQVDEDDRKESGGGSEKSLLADTRI